MVRSWWLNNYLDDRKSAPNSTASSIGSNGKGRRQSGPFDPDRFRNWRYYSDYAGGILVDQGAHVFDGIHMLMGAGYPESVTAAAGKPHRFDTPESVTACAEYPQDFMAVFTINYAAMKYKPHNDQLTQLDGDEARLDIGAGKLESVFARSGREDRRVDGIRTWIRPCHRFTCGEFSRVRTDAASPYGPGCARISGGVGGADGEYVFETRAALTLERERPESGSIDEQRSFEALGVVCRRGIVRSYEESR